MRFADLEPRFIRYHTREGREYTQRVETIEAAQGIVFLCPVCWQKNGGPIGTHGVNVSFRDRGVEPHQGSHNRAGAPSRWHLAGTGFGDLTLTPSIDISEPDGSGCGWHGYVTNGEAT